MKYDQFLSIYNSGPEATYKLLVSTMETSIKLSAQLAQLEERVKELEDRLNKNSNNSSKPPSSDEFTKPKSQRKKSGKRPGGQKGRKGKTLEMSANPDQVVTHQVTSCEYCGYRLEEVQPERIEKRQEYDIPPQEITVPNINLNLNSVLAVIIKTVHLFLLELSCQFSMALPLNQCWFT